MNILFVCTGNTCRSAMAEAWAKKICKDNPDRYGDFNIESAGVHCAGATPASEEAVKVCSEEGCDLSLFRAKQVKMEHMERADYIFAMTKNQKQMLEMVAPAYRSKIYLLNAYAKGTPDAEDIMDPYGGNHRVYEVCFGQLKESVEAVLEKLS